MDNKAVKAEKHRQALRALKVGSIIQGRVSGKWADVEVLEPLHTYMVVRKVGKTSKGSRYPKVKILPRGLRIPVNYRADTANVYADWLYEHNKDFAEAADALRQRFPLDDGK